MNPENTQRLLSDFPRLYRPLYIDPWRQDRSTLVATFGFECGDGWMDLIFRLSAALSEHAGQAGLDCVASQVKEKFGTLRFYVDGTDDVAQRLIDAAETESATICEICGAPAKLFTAGWHVTRCDAHKET